MCQSKKLFLYNLKLFYMSFLINISWNRLSYAMLFHLKLDGQGESWVGTINFALTIFIVIDHLIIIIITHSLCQSPSLLLINTMCGIHCPQLKISLNFGSPEHQVSKARSQWLTLHPFLYYFANFNFVAVASFLYFVHFPLEMEVLVILTPIDMNQKE